MWHLASALTPASLQGDVGILSGLLTSLDHISLADNLIGNWEHVHRICAALHTARTFDFSSNWPQFHCPFPPQPLTHVRVLILNACHLTWQDILHVAPSLPCLEELYLGGNGISELSAPGPELLKNLHSLDLQGNGLSRWHSVTCLSALPSLSSLQLSDNDLGSIEAPGEPRYSVTHFCAVPCTSLWMPRASNLCAAHPDWCP